MLFLLTINLLTSPDYLWVKWPALGWGLGLCLQGIKTFLRLDVTSSLLGADWEQRKLSNLLDKRSNSAPKG